MKFRTHVIIRITIVLLSFYVGFMARDQIEQPKIMASEYQAEIKWEYIETAIPTIRFVEVVREVHHTDVVYSNVPQLRFFEDKDELTEWVQDNLVADMGSQKCVAEALEMQRRAIADGYQVGVQALFPGVTQPEGQEWELVVSAFTSSGSMYYIWPTTGSIRWSGESIKRIQ